MKTSNFDLARSNHRQQTLDINRETLDEDTVAGSRPERIEIYRDKLGFVIGTKIVLASGEVITHGEVTDEQTRDQ
jgi:hypothetical protein